MVVKLSGLQLTIGEGVGSYGILKFYGMNYICMTIIIYYKMYIIIFVLYVTVNYMCAVKILKH